MLRRLLEFRRLSGRDMLAEDSEAAMGDNLLENNVEKSKPQITDQVSVQPVAVTDWSWCGTRVPKNQVTYMTQVILVYGIIAVSLSQLILQSADRELWLILLSTSVGYVLPSPRLKFLKPKISVSSAATAATTTTTTATAATSASPQFSLASNDIVDSCNGNESTTA